MSKSKRVFVFLVIFFFAIIFAHATAFSFSKAKYVFFFIGDGMGFSQVDLARSFYGELVFLKFDFKGRVITTSFDGGIPDSASSATALATGQKTLNRVIGMDYTRRKKLKSMAYLAKSKGMKVGIVTDVSLDDATPAAFYSCQPSRFNYYYIALDLVNSGFDYLVGNDLIGNSKKYRNERPNIIELARGKGCRVVRSMKELYSFKGKRALILFGTKEFSSKNDVTLATFVKGGIDFLYNDRGFLMIIEEGKIDWACHANDVKNAIEGIKALDEAVSVAFSFYKQHPEETLIVVTADHETGGLYLDSSYKIKWGTKGHTKAPVPIFAHGTGAFLFKGVLDNTDVAKNIMRVAGLAF
ncbi:MAG: alkaline phosphatase [Synergistetes bacterium]|nr:MAG: Alkaline phosphatase [bacterium 42_11]MBC7331948.1 alkaline phosphatase [Synergistota bacterium]MDK2871102.1 alkaline phosphatase [bacterium]